MLIDDDKGGILGIFHEKRRSESGGMPNVAQGGPYKSRAYPDDWEVFTDLSEKLQVAARAEGYRVSMTRTVSDKIYLPTPVPHHIKRLDFRHEIGRNTESADSCSRRQASRGNAISGSTAREIECPVNDTPYAH
jgi:hypothetical protein